MTINGYLFLICLHYIYINEIKKGIHALPCTASLPSVEQKLIGGGDLASHKI